MSTANIKIYSFADRLREVMRERKLKQTDIAKGLLVTQPSVSGWLNGIVPQPRTAAQLADFLGVNLKWLINGEGAKEPEKSAASEFRPDEMMNVTRQIYKEMAIHITDEEQDRGWVEVLVHYRSNRPPKGFPERVRLTRPERREAERLLSHIGVVKNPDAVTFACLPEKFRTPEFLDKLSPFFVLALEEAAFTLTFAQKGPELLKTIRRAMGITFPEKL